MPLRPATIDAHADANVVTDGGDDTETRNNDASFAQRRLLNRMLERHTRDAPARLEALPLLGRMGI